MLHIRDSNCVFFKISFRLHVRILCAIDLIFLICSTYYTSVVLANVLALLENGEPKIPISNKDTSGITLYPASTPTTTLYNSPRPPAPTLRKPQMIIVAAIISSSLQIFMHAIQIILVLILLLGVHKNILSNCKHWFTANVLLTIIMIISLIVNLSGKYFIVPTIITALYITYKFYMLWIVRLYTKRLILYLIHFKQSNDEDLE